MCRVMWSAVISDGDIQVLNIEDGLYHLFHYLQSKVEIRWYIKRDFLSMVYVSLLRTRGKWK